MITAITITHVCVEDYGSGLPPLVVTDDERMDIPAI